MFRKRALLPAALLVGCLQSGTEAAGGEEGLTRSQAQETIGAMIKTQIKARFFIGWWKADGRTPTAEPGMSLVQPGLLAAGLIQLGPQEREAERGTAKTLVSFTEKGKTEIETYPSLWTKTTGDACGHPDLKDGEAECWTVAAAERRLLRLVDFQADANEAVAEYAWHWIQTPYTEILGAGALVGLPSGIERPSSIRPSELAVWTAKAGKARATFRKFPEGWRILQPGGVSDSQSEWTKIQDVIDLASAPVGRHHTTVQGVANASPSNDGAESVGKRGSGAVGSFTQPYTLEESKPPYTNRAIDKKVQGTVRLKCVIGKNGKARDCRVLKSLGYGLDESAIENLTTKWRFQPGTRNGEPVDFEVTIEVRFALR